MNEIKQFDVNLDEDAFFRNCDFMVKKILLDYTSGDIEPSHHFMSEAVYQKWILKLQQNRVLHEKEIYEEVNVSSSFLRTYEDPENYYIEVMSTIRAIHYRESNGTIVGGDNTKRSSWAKKVLFQKEKLAKPLDVDRCEGCGVSLNIYQSGVCPHCGRVYDLRNYNYIIAEMD